ncbi:hypothetical protein D3H64_04845 [Atopobacter sp. AH10]|nr:hypothetical protein D3H64_04845 [Atopobacter sp. AH10]
MRWRDCLAIRMASSSRKMAGSPFLLTIYTLLASCIFSFFSIVVQFSNYTFTLLINSLVLYLIVLYNQPFITREFNNTRFLTYCTNPFVRLRLLFVLVADNNPIAYLLPVYLLINSLFNFFDPYKIFLLMYSLSIICHCLIVQQIVRERQRIACLLALSCILIISFYEIKIVPLLFLLNLGLLYFVLMKYVQLPITIDRQLNNKIVHSSSSYSGIFFIYKVVAKQIYRGSYKIVFFIVLSFLLGVLVSRFLANDFTSIFLYNAMLEFELQMDEKYKYLYKFLPKFYFLNNGQLSFFERYILSYNFISAVKIALCMIAFGLGTNVSVYKLLIYVALLGLLSITYFKMEEKMYSKKKKINNLIVQYSVFTLLSSTLLLINLL